MFNNADDSMAWDHQVRIIQSNAEVINALPVDQRILGYRCWIVQVDDFRNRWGMAYCPRDVNATYDSIRRAVSEHRRNGLPF
jgi:hypothetical protein